MARKKEDVEELMQQMEKSAHQVASLYRAKLDYSDKSVKTVERILGRVHGHFKKTRSEDGMHGIALFFAAYLGEVIGRNHGKGTWSRSGDFGRDTFPFHWRSSDLMLYQWCQKRIFDGKEDDVWVKYQALVLAELGRKAPRRPR